MLASVTAVWVYLNLPAQTRPTDTAASAPKTSPPVAPASETANIPVKPKKFVHATGYFEQSGDTWLEYPPHKFGYFRFIDKGVVDGYLYLVDTTRLDKGDPNRAFHLRLPVKGGMSQWSFPNPFIWRDLYLVTPVLQPQTGATATEPTGARTDGNEQ